MPTLYSRTIYVKREPFFGWSEDSPNAVFTREDIRMATEKKLYMLVLMREERSAVEVRGPFNNIDEATQEGLRIGHRNGWSVVPFECAKGWCIMQWEKSVKEKDEGSLGGAAPSVSSPMMRVKSGAVTEEEILPYDESRKKWLDECETHNVQGRHPLETFMEITEVIIGNSLGDTGVPVRIEKTVDGTGRRSESRDGYETCDGGETLDGTGKRSERRDGETWRDRPSLL